MPSFYEKFLQILLANKNTAQAPAMEAYMKNQFDYLGIKSPERKLLLKTFLKENPIPEGEDLKKTILLMWYNPYRELQYCAMDIMDKKIRTMDVSFISFFEKLILKKSWWDTVDWLAPNGCGKLFQKYPDQRLKFTDRWNKNENIWLQRSSILFQLRYREETDFDLLKRYILNHAGSKEFFVQKAAGWALRQYSKFNAKVVKDFITEYHEELSPLTIREGGKYT